MSNQACGHALWAAQHILLPGGADGQVVLHAVGPPLERAAGSEAEPTTCIPR